MTVGELCVENYWCTVPCWKCVVIPVAQIVPHVQPLPWELIGPARYVASQCRRLTSTPPPATLDWNSTLPNKKLETIFGSTSVNTNHLAEMRTMLVPGSGAMACVTISAVLYFSPCPGDNVQVHVGATAAVTRYAMMGRMSIRALMHTCGMTVVDLPIGNGCGVHTQA